MLFDYSSVYPFCLNEGQVLPTDRTGFVYCLISKKCHDQIYIGETSCLTQRLIQHNSGSGWPIFDTGHGQFQRLYAV